ncbi:3-dehydroquinate synthase [Lichenicola cladoniae]|uniref:Multifunctional fusion protein n=1 Tax=Lichenicola cladoniae TaxID=1484109 RepID=A0A6M8HNZ0_9PROT|nr:3-dehydroquinate synthase [Lichenicola cladoniae]NPD67482.1 3-dehydroquinate synthase [Acetobacteraceae bacterium]QKE89991.1 3-dehydroquinate synthase [Lichenicola cladoniae]
MSRPLETLPSPAADVTWPSGVEAGCLAARPGELPQPPDSSGPAAPQRSIVLVGLMGAGKTTVGRRLASRLGLPFRDADAEVELAAGFTIAELFARYGEAEFRRGEQGVIRRLLSGPPIVLATGGGAFMDPVTRHAIRRDAVSVWLRCPLEVLVRRVSGRGHRPLLAEGRPREILSALIERRHPVYAEADLIVDCNDDGVERTTDLVHRAVTGRVPPERVEVSLSHARYDVMVGAGLVARAGALLTPVLPQKRVVVVTDETVAALHLPTLLASLAETGIDAESIIVPPGEGSKSLACFGMVTDRLLALGIERRTAVIALGGGVIGDLAGFAAASVMRGLPFVQIPTTLLAQVDSSVGGKTGINTSAGKNLLGAFHQPIAVVADTDMLATLPIRELRAGYAEILKAGLIADPDLFEWCEANGAAVLAGDPAIQADAVRRACRFKAGVVGDDEREEKPDNGRALLNLGHTFAHALEAEMRFDGRLLHGEAVGIGLLLAFRLSVRLGLCPAADADRVEAHLRRLGMKTTIDDCGCALSASALAAHMQRDKKMRDGRISFVLVHRIGQAFTSRDIASSAVIELLQSQGCIVENMSLRLKKP